MQNSMHRRFFFVFCLFNFFPDWILNARLRWYRGAFLPLLMLRNFSHCFMEPNKCGKMWLENSRACTVNDIIIISKILLLIMHFIIMSIILFYTHMQRKKCSMCFYVWRSVISAANPCETLSWHSTIKKKVSALIGNKKFCIQDLLLYVLLCCMCSTWAFAHAQLKFIQHLVRSALPPIRRHNGSTWANGILFILAQSGNTLGCDLWLSYSTYSHMRLVLSFIHVHT